MSEVTKTTEKVQVHLDDAELVEIGRQLISKQASITALNLRKKKVAKQIAAEIAELEEAVELLSTAHVTKQMEREVDCLIYLNVPRDGRKTCTRVDTGEKVWETNMTPAECQSMLKLEEDHKAEAQAAADQRKAEEEAAQQESMEKEAEELLAEEADLGKPTATAEEQDEASRAEEIESAHGGDEPAGDDNPLGISEEEEGTPTQADAEQAEILGAPDAEEVRQQADAAAEEVDDWQHKAPTGLVPAPEPKKRARKPTPPAASEKDQAAFEAAAE